MFGFMIGALAMVSVFTLKRHRRRMFSYGPALARGFGAAPRRGPVRRVLRRPRAATRW